MMIPSLGLEALSSKTSFFLFQQVKDSFNQNVAAGGKFIGVSQFFPNFGLVLAPIPTATNSGGFIGTGFFQ